MVRKPNRIFIGVFFSMLFISVFSTGLFAERDMYVEGSMLFYETAVKYWESSEFNNYLETLGYDPLREYRVTFDYGVLFFTKNFCLGETLTLASFVNPITSSASNYMVDIYGSRIGVNRGGVFGSIKLDVGYALIHNPGFILTTAATVGFEWGYLVLGPNQLSDTNFESLLGSDGMLSKIRHTELSFGVSVKAMITSYYKYGVNDQNWYERSEYEPIGFFIEAGYSYVPFQGWKNVSYSGKADVSAIPSLGEHRIYVGIGISANMELELRRRGYNR